MRDPKRIDIILNKLKEIWKKNPDYRFTQLLINLNLISDGIHWLTEDDIIEDRLKKVRSPIDGLGL